MTLTKFPKLARLKKILTTALMSAWLRVPFGNICTFKNGDLTITVTKSFMVVISDGSSRDMLPVVYVSPELAYKIAVEMEKLGYPVDLSEIPGDVVEQLRSPDVRVRVTA